MPFTYVVDSEKLKGLMKERGITEESLIQQSGILKNTFDNMMSGIPCMCKSVYAVSGALRCPYYALIKDDEEDEESTPAKELKRHAPTPPYAETHNTDSKEFCMNRESVLDSAKEAVCGDRQQSYGTPENNFSLIAKLWSVYLGKEISAQDVAMLMVLFKTARIKSGTATKDSFVDIAGYAACGAEVSEAKNKSKDVEHE